MACGVPILVGNQDGSREAVVDGANGFILDPFDLDRIESVIDQLAVDEELRRTLAAGAIRVVRERFSYEAFRDKHKALYDLRQPAPAPTLGRASEART
jgi:phosphatidylinositol alpha-1,6-mannosyltransferase